MPLICERFFQSWELLTKKKFTNDKNYSVIALPVMNCLPSSWILFARHVVVAANSKPGHYPFRIQINQPKQQQILNNQLWVRKSRIIVTYACMLLVPVSCNFKNRAKTFLKSIWGWRIIKTALSQCFFRAILTPACQNVGSLVLLTLDFQKS
jgi:hypothetical protein